MRIKTIGILMTVLMLALFAPAPGSARETSLTENTFTTADGTHAYRVLLPDDYALNTRNYPTLYFMPYDGYTAEQYIEDGVPEALRALMAGDAAMDMIVVFPEFSPGDDVLRVIDGLIAHVEQSYRAMPGAAWRAAAGADAGGYISLLTALTDGAGAALSSPVRFSAAICHEGLLTQANPWRETYGDLCAILGADTSGLAHFYTYIDACVDQDAAYAPGGTNELCALMRGVAEISFEYDAFEYSLLTRAQYTDYVSALARSLNRVSERFARGLYAASFAIDRHAVSSDVPSVALSYAITVNEEALKTLCPNGEAVSAIVACALTDPQTGESTTLSDTYDILTDLTGVFAIDPALLAKGDQTDVTLTVTALGLTRGIGADALVRVADPVATGAGRVIDLMGDWRFLAYKAYSPDGYAKEDMDDISYVSQLEIADWDEVQPGLGWWTGDFAASLKGDANFAGFAWYARAFEVPEGFDDAGLFVAAGMFDEADEVYINGVRIGSTGFDAEGGNYDGSNPWDVNRLYALPEGVLRPGANMIFVRTCNSSGGGGWYTGPIGLYAMGAYNAKRGLPSAEADARAKDAVLLAVDRQLTAIREGDLSAYLATVADEYYGSGLNRTQLIETMRADIETRVAYTDENEMVFVTEDEYGTPLYLYQALRAREGGAETVYLYFAEIDGEMKLYGAHERFFTTDTYSDALGATGVYHVYLPEGYFSSDERYPVVYMLHGFGSTGLSFQIAGVPEKLDEAMRNGARKSIVVFPDDGNKYSWWRDAFAAWVTDDLIPHIDQTLRTVPDRRFRAIAGESMGGGGAYNLLLSRGDLFSGIIDIYGAISYAGSLQMASGATGEYLAQFTHYLFSGNHDSYVFDTATASMSQLLRAHGVKHVFFVDNGEHSSAFYLPFIGDAFAYTVNAMPVMDGASESVKASLDKARRTETGDIAITLNVDAEKARALCQSALINMASSDAVSLPLTIPVTVAVLQGERTVYEKTLFITQDTRAVDLTIPGDVLPEGEGLTLTARANVLAQAISLLSGALP